ncbi:MAG: PEP-CTERM sorting domain-containing protein [Burkholderiaceae bacterium]|nr:PEP-CTERM sorting domain-containing protein [Burkholderiaceae bacterium]MDH3461706.1 PEP-CTERM sorting domain-containing protein [Burkholderiaceae bacterium]
MTTSKTRQARWMAALAAVVMVGSAQAVPVAGQGTWDDPVLGLQGRDLDGNAANGPEAFYDTVLDITWLRDMNYAKTSGFDSDGRMHWTTAKAWATNLVYGGFSDWRLPTALNADGSGPCGGRFGSLGCTGSEMGHLWYVDLGNPAFGPMSNTGDFQNLQSLEYWTGTVYAPDPNIPAWLFDTRDGRQAAWDDHFTVKNAMAVRSGDVVAVIPEPQTYAMLLAGLGVLAVMRRRRQG